MRTKNIIKTTFQIFFCFLFLSPAHAQNEIKFVQYNFYPGIDVFEYSHGYLYYSFQSDRSDGDTVIAKLNFKKGKIYTSKFLSKNGEFTNIITEKEGLESSTTIKISGEKYLENGLIIVTLISGYTDYYSICTSQIYIVSKSKIKTNSSDIYKVNECGVTSNERLSENHLKLWRENDQSLYVYGMNDQSHLQFYNVLGKIIGHRIISRGEDFYKIELAEPIFPVFVNFNGSRQKL